MFFIKLIIPCYNCEKTIGKMLDSILNQNFQNFFIIAINDKSTDNTIKILKEYEIKNSNKIKIIDVKEKHYAGGCRNIGIEQHINAVYTWFIDADDQISNNALQIIYNEYLKTNADMYTINSNIFQYNKHYAPWFRIIKNTIEIKKFLQLKCCEDVAQFFEQYEIINEKNIVHINKILYLYSGMHQPSINYELLYAYKYILNLNLTKQWLIERCNQLKNVLIKNNLLN